MVKLRISIAAIGVAGLVSTAMALDPKTDAMLKRLDPETRSIQVCGIEAMRRIGRDANPFHPDRVMIDQITEPKKNGNVLQGSGGVIRSGGEWYHLSYSCRITDDHFSVLSFDYKVGARINRDQWDDLGLYP
jgi:hypothetical protein